MKRRPRSPARRVASAGALLVALLPAAGVVFAQPPQAGAPTEPAPPAPASTPATPDEDAPTTAPPPPAASSPKDPTRGDAMRAYHAAMTRRRLGSQQGIRAEQVSERVAEAEQLVSTGRYDDAISRLTETVEHPTFDNVAETEQGRAALYLLGEALASAGIYESARAYLRKSIASKSAWEQRGAYARRAVRRIVEVALETQRYQDGLSDLSGLPPSLPEEVRGEVSYLTGRAKEAGGDPDAALVEYGRVTQTSRFWSQATYLSGLIHVERGRMKQGEDLFCKVADPKRQDTSTPVFADERFFAVRDLARLALGRVAHEQSRFDDSRYYYYLVPRDSDRLAEALYESATSRYEKKDYDGARELLDELRGLKAHHRYEDEAQILDAYVDLALCKFEDADKKLVTFLKTYEPVRDSGRRITASPRAMAALLAAARAGGDPGGADLGASVSREQLRAVAALVRVDPLYVDVAKRRVVLEREASGLTATRGALSDMQKSLATTGGVRPATEEGRDPAEASKAARAALDGVRRAIDDLETARAPADKLSPLREEAKALEARLTRAVAASGAAAADPAAGADLPDLLASDAAKVTAYSTAVERTKAELAAAENALARDALRRLDLRLSRLLRRARLGRIESVLGRKRALEVEIEAIGAGYLPPDAVDSLDAARYLEDNEEYWPFEGDDWPDEFVGSEGLK
jgi:hypothetical protein